jgi:hypothetical protein
MGFGHVRDQIGSCGEFFVAGWAGEVLGLLVLVQCNLVVENLLAEIAKRLGVS